MKTSPGFTLAEILVYIAILTIVLGATVSLFLWIVNSSGSVQAQQTVQRNAQSVMQVLNREIRRAESVYAPTTTSSQLSLETDESPVADNFGYIDFFLCDTRLCLKREGGGPVALTAEEVEVTSIAFTEITTGAISSVRVEVDMRYVNPSGRPELDASITASSTTSLRAY